MTQYGEGRRATLDPGNWTGDNAVLVAAATPAVPVGTTSTITGSVDATSTITTRRRNPVAPRMYAPPLWTALSVGGPGNLLRSASFRR
jgi:hypothetical protein